MAWTDYSQKFRGQLMLHRPRPLKTAQVNEPGGITYPLEALDYDNEVGDTLPDWGTNYSPQTYCAITFGDAPGGNEKGDTINNGTSDSTDVIAFPFAPNGIRPGEVDIADNDYLTWWDDYRPHFIPPRYFYDSPTLYYYKKGRFVQYSLFPMLRMGASYFGFAGASGYSDVDFVAEAYNSNHGTYLSGTDWNTPAFTTLTASSTNGGNVPANTQDGSTVTYWQSTGNTNEWVKWQRLADSWVLSYYSFDCQVSSTATATWEVQWSDDDVTYTTVAWEEQTVWTAGKYYFFLPDQQEGHEYWRILLKTANGGATFQIHEIEIFANRPSYTLRDWELSGGTFAVGGASSTSITARFYPGMYWVHKGANYSLLSQMFCGHRPVCILDTNREYPSKDGATYDASATEGAFVADNAYDDDYNVYWRTPSGTTTGWVEIEFPTFIEIAGDVTIHSLSTLSPDTATFQQYNPITAAWEDIGGFTATTTADFPNLQTPYTFSLDKPGFSNRFRLNITANNGGTYILISLIKFPYRHPHGFLMEETEVLSHTMTPEGQIMQFRIYEDISDFPKRALVMFRGDEYYAGVKGSLTDADPTGLGREGFFFQGWIDERRTNIHRNSEGRIAHTDITVLDLAGWMQRFAGISQFGARQKDLNTTGPVGAGLTFNLDNIPNLNIARMIWYLLFYDCVGLELADLYPPDNWEKYAFPLNQAQGGSIYRNADGRAQTIAHRLTFNKMGQFKVLPDPMLQAVADRTTEVQAVIDPESIKTIDWASYDSSRIGRQWSDAQQRSHEGKEGTDKTDPLNLVGFACVAPDQDVYGQGGGELDQGEQLVVDQTELNAREGNRYAVRNNPAGSFIEVELKPSGDNGLDPARMSWVELSLAAQFQRLKNIAPANLTGLWWCNETGGTLITDYSGNEFDGVPTAVTLGWFDGPDFEPMPKFTGVSSYVDVFSAGLASAFDENTGTLAAWVYIPAEIIGDGEIRYIAAFKTSSSDYVGLAKNGSDSFFAVYQASGTFYFVTLPPITPGIHHLAMTWDIPGSGEVKGYLDGIEGDDVETPVAVWTGGITTAYIGSYSTTTWEWLGGVSLVGLLDIPLTADQIKILAKNDAIRGPDGETFAGERFLLVKKSIDYEHGKMKRTPRLILEREAVGVLADTYVKPS